MILKFYIERFFYNAYLNKNERKAATQSKLNEEICKTNDIQKSEVDVAKKIN